MKLFRQGDVLLQQVKSLPKGAKDETPAGRIVLAFGEVTGHAHAIENEHRPRGAIRSWSAPAGSARPRRSSSGRTDTTQEDLDYSRYIADAVGMVRDLGVVV